MEQVNVPIISLIISVITTAVVIGISVGVFKSKLREMETNVNGLGKRFDDDLSTIKNDYIKENSERIKSSEHQLINLASVVGRLEEKIISMHDLYNNIQQTLNNCHQRMRKDS